MPGFMMVSGYFSAREVKDFHLCIKRVVFSVQHYALPFFSWFIMVDILLLGKMGRNPITGIVYLLTHVDSGLWFLWVVFILSIEGTLINYALSSEKRPLLKAGTLIVICFGVLLGLGLTFGICFFGIKYIFYYTIFYGFGWLVKWSESWWKQWWLKSANGITFICLVIFLAIVFNFDLYHTGDGIISIAMRCIAGFTGNAVILVVCEKYESILSKVKIDWLGMYTLEIYATHMCVNHLMEIGEGFFTTSGFGTFICSSVLTVTFTTIIIAVFKAIPVADYVFYGKVQKVECIV